ncbi:MAG TPA: HD-GYP domain-containing protein [Burkholderiales bacterium]|nr:HD-GYP domain-containing protein [Burkholderiales bacterium]
MSELQFGMYVAELDRPWTDTPFMFQGFILRTREQLEALKKYCRVVYVDPERSQVDDDPPPRKVYAQETTVEREFPAASAAYRRSEPVVRDIFASVRAGRTLDAEHVRQAVFSMTDSVLRNPDALLLFSQLREKGEYTHSHALDVAVYMVAFGRFLQMDRDDIAMLGYLGMLQDIGKVRLPDELLYKRDRLSEAEFERAKRHVRDSVEILKATPGLPPRLPELAALHHERQDGSGYPRGLAGRDIGTIGAIAGIVDTFDALTARRPYAEPVAPSAALSMLYKWRGAFFDAALVEQFIRCIGIFPVGSTVELNSGEVGIVIAQNLAKRLQPRVMVIRDAQGQPLRPQKLLDLSRGPKAPGGDPYRIRRTLEFGRIQTSVDELFLQ